MNKLRVGTWVQWVDANNRMRRGVIVANPNTYWSEADLQGRVCVKGRDGSIARPTADRVAPLRTDVNWTMD
jgi:hypothetical protein